MQAAIGNPWYRKWGQISSADNLLRMVLGPVNDY